MGTPSRLVRPLLFLSDHDYSLVTRVRRLSVKLGIELSSWTSVRRRDTPTTRRLHCPKRSWVSRTGTLLTVFLVGMINKILLYFFS